MRTPGVVCLAMLFAQTVLAQHHEMHTMSKSGWQAAFAGTAFVQYVQTFDTRGAYQFGSVNRVMLHATGPGAGGTVGLHVMGSAELLTLGARGAPQLLQAAFHANGEMVTDHVHPSPWLMELAGSYDAVLSEDLAVSFYAAAIGEPVLGPPVYLHRASATANPVVPLGHHLQDDTHSSYGVLSYGMRWPGVQLELSAFNDRQPEEVGPVFYYDGARLDASAGRATISAGKGWSLFGTYGYMPATTGGHAHDAQHRIGVGALRDAKPWSLSIVYAANNPVGAAGPRHSLLAEGQWEGADRSALYFRVEYVQRTAEELALVGSISAIQDIESMQVGYSRALASRGTVVGRLGAHITVDLVGLQLEPFYGMATPFGIAVYGELTAP